MYNNIFQVSTEPFARERQATADDVLAFSDIPMTAVRPAENRSYALQDFQYWLQSNRLGICDAEKFILFPTAPELYFRDQIEDFRKAALKLAYVPESDFLRDNGIIRNLLHDLRNSYDTVLNTYVMVDDETPITMDAFIRTAELDTPYYFGSVFDCRFG